MPFLPTTREELEKLGWHQLDIIIVSGDSYMDSPYIGSAVIGRTLSNAGFKVGIIAQPDIKSDVPGWDLTPREREVLGLMVKGKTNPEIAELLFVSRATVKAHVSNILSKLGVSNRAEAVALTVENKILN